MASDARGPLLHQHRCKQSPHFNSKIILKLAANRAPQNKCNFSNALYSASSSSSTSSPPPNMRHKNNLLFAHGPDETEPVVEHLREYSDKWVADRNVNLEGQILEQIALEGLSGITLKKLFLILDATNSNLHCIKDKNCSEYVWGLIVNQYFQSPSGMEVKAYYVNPRKRSDKPSKDGAENSISKTLFRDKEIKLPPQTIERFAKSESTLYPVQDGIIMGSCRNYTTRQDITQHLLNISQQSGIRECLHALNKSYGIPNVYLVAGQEARAKALLPNWADPNVDIKLREYCTLELIGKSRTLGTVFPKDKTLGRYRIMLISKGFITQFQETSSSPIEHHLKRFSFNRPPSKFEETIAKNKARQQNDSDSEDEEGRHNLPIHKLCYNPGLMKVDRSILSIVYDAIAESHGLIALDIRRKLQLPKFHVRNHLKNLLAIKMVYNKTLQNDDKYGVRMFKTTLKSMKRRQKRAELAQPTGIMVSWDEADLRAKRIIGHRRSSFSQSEDSLLILCRITSILMQPNLKLNWCVNKRVIRDILHKELVESHDKTSDACLRRIKYLRRLPNNIMSINELTAELRDDPDVKRLVQPDKPMVSDNKLIKLFSQVLRLVRAKVPNLLGVAPSPPVMTTHLGSKIWPHKVVNNKLFRDDFNDTNKTNLDVKNSKQLMDNFEMIDCQSVASITRSPTYDKPKNLVDIKINTASLVTMAFSMTSHLAWNSEERHKLASFPLLDKFYSNYPDKLINSMLSKLNKRSLLTRKNANDRSVFYKGKTRVSFKLNQSVSFLLNRYQSHSLVQLARPISPRYEVNLSESNQMLSIALLTSLCSWQLFNLDLKLKVPANVVGIDQGNENFRNLCERASDETKEILSRFMSRCGEGSIKTPSSSRLCDQQIPQPATSPVHTPAPEPIASEMVISEVEVDETGTYATMRPVQDLGSMDVDQHQPGDSVAGQYSDVPDGIPAYQCQESDKELIGKAGSSGIGQQQVSSNNKIDDSRRALFLLRHELKSHALDKCGSLADCLVVQPCNIKFSSRNQLVFNTEPMDRFLQNHRTRQVGDPELAKSNWLARTYLLADVEKPADESTESAAETKEEPEKIPIEFDARLWKSIDGNTHLPTLFKLIESLLSWIIVYPGVELVNLSREFCHLIPEEHLIEIIDLMSDLNLITKHEIKVQPVRPKLFGYSPQPMDETGNLPVVTTYEPTAEAFIHFSQLLNYLK